MRHAPLCDSPGADVPQACHNSVSTSAVAGDPGRLGTMVREDGGGEVPVPAVGRLTTSDLQFIVTTLLPDVDPSVAVTVLRRDPDRVEELLDDERLFKRLRSEDALVRVSPWLLFTVLLRRVRRELRALPYTVEQRGGERVAVFDAERAGALLGDREIQDYLIELLVSFTRTDSLSLEVEEAGRLRRRRFSDLSSEDMIALAALMPEDLRFPILRRVAVHQPQPAAAVQRRLLPLFPCRPRGAHRRLYEIWDLVWRIIHDIGTHSQTPAAGGRARRRSGFSRGTGWVRERWYSEGTPR